MTIGSLLSDLSVMDPPLDKEGWAIKLSMITFGLFSWFSNLFELNAVGRRATEGLLFVLLVGWGYIAPCFISRLCRGNADIFRLPQPSVLPKVIIYCLRLVLMAALCEDLWLCGRLDQCRLIVLLALSSLLLYAECWGMKSRVIPEELTLSRWFEGQLASMILRIYFCPFNMDKEDFEWAG